MTDDRPGTETGIVTKLSPRTVAGTVSRLTSVASARGMKLFAVIDQSAQAPGRACAARHHPGDLRQPGRRHAGDGRLATGRARPAAQGAGLGRRWTDQVSCLAPAALAARHQLSPGLAGNLAGIDPLTDALIAP
jgi:hypothetical protein